MITHAGEGNLNLKPANEIVPDCFTFGVNVRTLFNSESDPPPDLKLSTTPEERADNLPLHSSLMVASQRCTEEHRLDCIVAETEGFPQSVFHTLLPPHRMSS